jgi:hypothetical protein
MSLRSKPLLQFRSKIAVFSLAAGGSASLGLAAPFVKLARPRSKAWLCHIALMPSGKLPIISQAEQLG